MTGHEPLYPFRRVCIFRGGFQTVKLTDHGKNSPHNHLKRAFLSIRLIGWAILPRGSAGLAFFHIFIQVAMSMELRSFGLSIH